MLLYLGGGEKCLGSRVLLDNLHQQVGFGLESSDNPCSVTFVQPFSVGYTTWEGLVPFCMHSYNNVPMWSPM